MAATRNPDPHEELPVARAAASLGLDARWRGPMLAQLLPAGTDRLSDRMRDAILAIVRAAVAESWQREADEPGHPGADLTLEWPKTDETSRRAQTDHAGA
jgi:hypothetical protein